MYQRSLIPRFPSRPSIKSGWRCAAMVFLIVCCRLTVDAQGGFVSGSTGADGAFNPTANVAVTLPESGVFNFTTINIPTNVTVRFGKNSRNTPVTLLATGNVTIAGTIDVSGSHGAAILGGPGGPGGFSGGNGGPVTGGTGYSPGVSGDGPGGGGGGGGTAPNAVGSAGGGGFSNSGLGGLASSNQVGAEFIIVNGAGGPRYGLPSLVPLIGGSGGGGEVGRLSPGAGGGGGGGALLIASSGNINFTSNPSQIIATGGNGTAFNIGSAGGSGGAVRLIGNLISGTLRIDAGGGGGFNGGNGAGGYIRIEAFDTSALQLSLSGSPRVSISTPKTAVPANLPVIVITSVAGIAPPTAPGGSLQGGPDIILPANQPNPVTVALTAANVPLGTTLQVALTPENGARVITQSSALAGTLATSMASASVSIPDGICVIQASGTIDVGASAMMIDGERVKSIEVTATFGGKPTLTYITASNKRVRVDQ